MVSSFYKVHLPRIPICCITWLTWLTPNKGWIGFTMITANLSHCISTCMHVRFVLLYCSLSLLFNLFANLPLWLLVIVTMPHINHVMSTASHAVCNINCRDKLICILVLVWRKKLENYAVTYVGNWFPIPSYRQVYLPNSTSCLSSPSISSLTSSVIMGTSFGEYPGWSLEWIAIMFLIFNVPIIGIMSCWDTIYVYTMFHCIHDHDDICVCIILVPLSSTKSASEWDFRFWRYINTINIPVT